MKLNIPSEEAIKILQSRLSEIDIYGFNPKAWKDRTVLDLREIFPVGSTQWLQVSHITFDTFVKSEKINVLNEGKTAAKKLIASYIEFINDYSKIAVAKKVISEKDFEQKYYDLLKEWNELVPGYNDLLKKYDSQLDKTEGLLEDIEIRDEEIERIKTETIQLDNVSFKKLWTALLNLPSGQLIGVFTTSIALLIGSFTLGTLYERTNSNNELFDLRNSNKELKFQNEKIKLRYDSLKSVTTYGVDNLNEKLVKDTITKRK
jgi:hypothetical protein